MFDGSIVVTSMISDSAEIQSRGVPSQWIHNKYLYFHFESVQFLGFYKIHFFLYTMHGKNLLFWSIDEFTSPRWFRAWKVPVRIDFDVFDNKANSEYTIFCFAFDAARRVHGFQHLRPNINVIISMGSSEDWQLIINEIMLEYSTIRA